MTCALQRQAFWGLHGGRNIHGTARLEGLGLRSSFQPPNLEQISSIGMQCNYNASLKRWDGHANDLRVTPPIVLGTTLYIGCAIYPVQRLWMVRVIGLLFSPPT